MSRASEQSLSALHGLLAETLISEITEAKFVIDKDGKAHPARISPALLAQAIKFLKDNGIDAPAKTGSKLAALSAELENLPDDIPLYN